MSQKVFVSYHKDNNLAVKKLHDDLQKRGIKTWLDAKDIKPGQPKRESLLGLYHRFGHGVGQAISKR